MHKPFWLLVWLAIWSLSSHAQSDTQPPTVISTNPPNGSQNVDPGLTMISVTFNEAMKDRSWSWSYQDQARFPRISADPSYDGSFTVNTLPVELVPNHDYEIWLNSSRYQGFMDQAANPLTPYRWTFSTSAARL